MGRFNPYLVYMITNTKTLDLIKNANKNTIRKNLLLNLSSFLTEKYYAYGSLDIKVDSMGIEIVTHYNKMVVYSTDVMPYSILYVQLVEVFAEIAMLIIKEIYLGGGPKGINRNDIKDLFPFIFTSIGFMLEGHSEIYTKAIFTKKAIENITNNYSEAKQNLVESDIPDLSEMIAENLMNSYIDSKEDTGKVEIQKSILIIKFG